MKVLLWLLLPALGFFLFVKEDSSTLISKRTLPLHRKIASDNSTKCMRDLFKVENLKKEVQELEAQLDTNRISGRWRHLDLSQLPTPAADFIRRYADKLGDQNGIDASSCADVPCLFNLVYGTPDGIAGYVHYLWFLRTNSYLAADDQVPDQASPFRGTYNGRNFPVSSYLYNDEELLAYWRLSKAIRSPHTTLTYLKEIQRIPRGELFEGRASSACGLAHSNGWITLTDKCLTVYPLSDSGYLYVSVLHEMTHQLDFEEGLRHDDEFYRSQWKDFLDLTGFELREYQDSNGQTVRQWNIRPGYTQVTAYARNSPPESFAELLGYFRFDGDKTKRTVSPEMFDFAKTYFQGKSFENHEQASRWIKEASLRRTKDILKSLASCTDVYCEHATMETLAREEIGRFRSQEPDGCKAMSDPYIGQTMPSRMKGALMQTADNLQSHLTIPAIKEALLENFDELMSPSAAYESFFACHSNGSDCYSQKIAQKKSSQFEEYGQASSDLLATYEATFPWENISTEVRSFYQSLLASRDGVMKIKADELWEGCKKIPQSDSVPPSGSDYIVREGYMMSSFYNCLNRGFKTSLDGAIDAVKLQEFSPRNPDERAFLLSLMRSRFTEILDEKLNAGRAKEIKYRDAFTKQHGQWLYNNVRSSNFWRPRQRVDQAALELACKNGALRMIGGEVFFHLKKDLYQDLLIATCAGIR